MLRFFRHIPSESRLQCVALAKIWINRIAGLTQIFHCPFRDYLSVEMMNPITTPCAVRYNIYRARYFSRVHIAYLKPTLKLRSARRHTVLLLHAKFYPYSVPTGQSSSVKSLNP